MWFFYVLSFCFVLNYLPFSLYYSNQTIKYTLQWWHRHLEWILEVYSSMMFIVRMIVAWLSKDHRKSIKLFLWSLKSKRNNGKRVKWSSKNCEWCFFGERGWIFISYSSTTTTINATSLYIIFTWILAFLQ